jgi:hypothetical protein
MTQGASPEKKSPHTKSPSGAANARTSFLPPLRGLQVQNLFSEKTRNLLAFQNKMGSLLKAVNPENGQS